MNEKIKDLAIESKILECIDECFEIRGDWLPYMEKFAELIVAECADKIWELGEKLAKQRPNSFYDSVAYECAELIKTHFGVEE